MTAKKQGIAVNTNAPIYRKDGFRDFVESIMIALILAFLFRTFEAEAFVIPTGSMAPTLWGRNKNVAIEGSDFYYTVGASEEVDQRTGNEIPERKIWSATAPLYAEPVNLGERKPPLSPAYSYSGDRILVSKVAYWFNDPERWDVIVFKYPLEAATNFIKRLIGLPWETIVIFRGDIYVAPKDETKKFQMQRKSPPVMRAMLQIVHDNDVQLESLRKVGWPDRWTSQSGPDAPWTTSADGRSFSVAAPAGKSNWLRYQHVLPTYQDWELIHAGEMPKRVRQRLVTDFCHYNTSQPFFQHKQRGHWTEPTMPPSAIVMGLHWVGDLAVDTEWEIEEIATQNAETWLELVYGGDRFQCQFDLHTGIATLYKQGSADMAPVKLTRSKTATTVRGTGRHRVSFHNVDRELTLLANGTWIEFEAPVQYGTELNFDNFELQGPNPLPNAADQQPAGLALRGAKGNVSHLKIWRDIYYIANRDAGFEGPDYPYPPRKERADLDYPTDPNNLEYWATFLSQPEGWDVFLESQHVEMALKADQFLCLGDNSQKSSDSRLWPGGAHQVDRSLILGKAMFIYWPHAWETSWHTDFPAGRWGQLQVPFYPNFRRMNFIR